MTTTSIDTLIETRRGQTLADDTRASVQQMAVAMAALATGQVTYRDGGETYRIIATALVFGPASPQWSEATQAVTAVLGAISRTTDIRSLGTVRVTADGALDIR